MGTISSSQAGASSHDHHLSLMTAAATGKYERVISWLRVAFCAANLLLSAWTWDRLGDTHIARVVVPLGLVVIVGTAAFSILVDIKVRRGAPITTRLLAISISADICVTFAALLVNPYWAKEGYYGIVRSPDLGVLLLLVIASGFRLRFWLSVLSGGLASIGYLLLLWADHAWAAEYVTATFEQELFFGLEIVFATAAACAISSIGHGQVERVATESIAESRRGRILDVLLTGLHGLENTVMDLNWVVEQEGLSGNERLQESVKAVHGSCKEVRRSSTGKTAETSSGGEIESVVLRDVLERALQEMRGRFSRDVTISLTDRTPVGTIVDVHGGAAALYDMVVCLIHNSTEGSGADSQALRSRSIEVHASIDWLRPYVRIDVRDDGPGFARESMLGRATTKGEGHGTGLATVRKYATRSLGSLRCRNIGSRGAEVTLWLPGRAQAVAPASGQPERAVP
jgi:signal transduction histidine kinase